MRGSPVIGRCCACKSAASVHCPFLLLSGPRIGKPCGLSLCPEHDKGGGLCRWHRFLTDENVVELAVRGPDDRFAEDAPITG